MQPNPDNSESQPTPDRFRLAVLQPPLATGQIQSNRDLIRRQVGNLASDAPLDIVVLPEIYDGRMAANDGDDDRTFLAELARDHKTHVIGGSCIVEKDAASFNRTYVVARDGTIVGQYDKRVLFSGEARIRQPGEHPGIFELDGLRVAVLICADAWFPELGRELVNRADMLAIPVKSTVPSQRHVTYGRQTWYALTLTRAMENGLVVAAADWATGVHSANPNGTDRPSTARYFTCGAASIVDPSHRPAIDAIQQTIPDGLPGTLVANIDPAALIAYRTYRKSVGLLPS